MRLRDLAPAALADALNGPGLALDFGVARARVRSDVAALAPVLQTVYGGYGCLPADGLFEVTARLRHGRGWRRWVRPQVEFVADGSPLFEPFPADTTLPLLEWGINWLLADRVQQHLVLHAGVVEQGGRAVVLPAMPGSGKSTLTAALATRGFRLLSDEFGVVRLADGQLLALLRPVALKNASIEVLRGFAPGAVIGPAFAKTRKGTVAHLAPADDAWDRRHQPARPSLVLFPRWQAGAALAVEPIPTARAFARFAVNSFNYEILGASGFDAVRALLEQAACYRLVYGALDDAVQAVERLLADTGP